MRESATGLGYGAGRLLLRIELPLALPVIMAGLRVATVSTVALTTVGSLVAYGGLGNLIKDGVNTNFRAELMTAAVLCVVLAVVLDVLLVLTQRVLTPWTRGVRTLTVFTDTWDYLTTASNWTGDGGMLELLLAAAAAQLHRARHRGAVGLPLALWLGHLGRGGFLAINVSNVGRAVPTFALLALLVTFDFPGRAEFGPYGRAGLATLIALALFALPPIITNAYVAVREVAARRQGVGPRHGDDRPAAVLPGRAAARDAAGRVRRPARARAGVGDRDDRGAGRRTGAGRVITDGFFRTNYGKGIAGAVVVAVVALVLELLAALAERAVIRSRGTGVPGS